MYALYTISKKVTNVKNGKPLIIPISLIIFALALLPKNLVYAHQIEYSLYTFVSIPLLFIILPAILIFANRKYKKFIETTMMFNILIGG